MKMAMPSAPNTSSKIKPMTQAYVEATQGHGRRAQLQQRAARLALAMAAVLAAASCTTITPADDPAASVPSVPSVREVVIQQPASRWIQVAWSALPGFADDRIAQALPALKRNCDKPSGPWVALCQELLASAPSDDAGTRAWLMQRFDAYRIESPQGQSEGLATGYFEPAFEASRAPRGAMRHALHKAPADLAMRKPWFTREQSETLPAAQAALRGREIAYVADPLDVLMVQIQGSGRLHIAEPDGRSSNVRIAFAGHNDQPYQSVGRWLIQQGEIRADNAGWPAIRDWARRNPARLNQMLWSNPRLVFFREEPLPDPSLGPRGAQGVPLTPERSIAVDPKSVPYGTPIWLDTTEPATSTPLRRLVVAQDTGGAIVGAVRADYFWGPGERAEQQASKMKQKLKMWALWPKAQPR